MSSPDSIPLNMQWCVDQPESPQNFCEETVFPDRSFVEVRHTTTGRGLFATRDLPPGTVISDAPVFHFAEVSLDISCKIQLKSNL